MAPSTPANHDPALSHGAPAAPAQQPPAQGGGMPTNLSAADLSSMHLNGLDQNQIMNLLRSLPGVFTKVRGPFVSPCLVCRIPCWGGWCWVGGDGKRQKAGEGRWISDLYTRDERDGEHERVGESRGGRALVLALRAAEQRRVGRGAGEARGDDRCLTPSIVLDHEDERSRCDQRRQDLPGGNRGSYLFCRVEGRLLPCAFAPMVLGICGRPQRRQHRAHRRG